MGLGFRETHTKCWLYSVYTRRMKISSWENRGFFLLLVYNAWKSYIACVGTNLGTFNFHAFQDMQYIYSSRTELANGCGVRYCAFNLLHSLDPAHLSSYERKVGLVTLLFDFCARNVQLLHESRNKNFDVFVTRVHLFIMFYAYITLPSNSRLFVREEKNHVVL